jgi:hypothetical protein
MRLTALTERRGRWGRSTAPSIQRYLDSFGKSSTEEGVILCEMTVDGQREMPPWKRMKPLRPKGLSYRMGRMIE